jgi:hypothetical protein
MKESTSNFVTQRKTTDTLEKQNHPYINALGIVSLDPQVSGYVTAGQSQSCRLSLRSEFQYVSTSTNEYQPCNVSFKQAIQRPCGVVLGLSSNLVGVDILDDRALYKDTVWFISLRRPAEVNRTVAKLAGATAAV